jgi:hypothetical protein
LILLLTTFSIVATTQMLLLELNLSLSDYILYVFQRGFILHFALNHTAHDLVTILLTAHLLALDQQSIAIAWLYLLGAQWQWSQWIHGYELLMLVAINFV